MSKAKLKYLVWALLFVGLAAGCNRKPQSYGEGTAVFIVADEPTWQALENPLRATFQRTLHTPGEEQLFGLKWIAPDKFKDVATRKNLVLVGLIDSEGEINSKVGNILSEPVKARVRDGSAFVFPKEDPWARDQKLLVIAGTSVEQLRENLVSNQTYLYSLFYDKLVEETSKKMFQTREQKDLSADMLKKYGWTIRIQHDYFVNIERPDQNFVMLRRSLPGRERWLFVNWVESENVGVPEEKWVLERRNFLTRKFYKGDKVYENDKENYRQVSRVGFGNREAIRIDGLWVNEEDLAKATGGPFRTYAFYDADTRRIYMIDIAVWFPAGSKEPLLRQLDIMARTFKTNADILRSKDGHRRGE